MDDSGNWAWVSFEQVHHLINQSVNQPTNPRTNQFVTVTQLGNSYSTTVTRQTATLTSIHWILPGLILAIAAVLKKLGDNLKL